MFDLILLLSANHHLLAKVLLDKTLLAIHLGESGLQGLFVLLGLGELDLNVAQRLLELFDL